MREALTPCEVCGKDTKTFGGRCPVCGEAKMPPAIKPPAKWIYRSAGTDLEAMLSARLMIVAGLALLAAALLAIGEALT